MKSHFTLKAFQTGLLLTVCLFPRVYSKQIYSGHKVTRFIPATREHLNDLSSAKRFSTKDVEFWKPPSRKRAAVEIRLSQAGIFNNVTQKLASHAMKHQVQTPNLQTEIEGQDHVSYLRSKLSWFEKYHPLDEIFSWLRKTASECKERCHIFTLGESYERRQLYAIEIHENRQVPKPLIFINCGIHAREWVSPATCMYIINQLVFPDPNDISVSRILNKVDVVILPVFNVDGYVYTWEKDRMWRKNRSLNPGSNCVGTDLNRNWGLHWGETGASSHPCSPAYRGRAAMSEEEVQSVAKFLESQKHRLVGYLDIHSYGQMILFPWGYSREQTEDQDELTRVAKAMVDAMKIHGDYHTNYSFGQASNVLYIESGTTKDYVYGHLNVKYAFSVELRDKGKNGFLLPRQMIEPTAREAFEGVKAMILNIKLNDFSFA